MTKMASRPSTEPDNRADADTGVRWRRGLCGICPAGCWVEVGLDDDDRMVDIRAEDGHPLGMICRRGIHAPEIVYGEDRLRHPMRRAGPRGDHDSFERITWDEAYDAIVDRLETIRAESGPEAVAIYTGRGAFELSLCDFFQPEGVAVSSASNVLFPFGSPNTMGVGALCYVSFAMIAPHVTMGRMLVDMFVDIEHADTLVVWGANPATDSPPLDMHRLEAAAKRGADIVVIDPRRTETVRRTGAEWVPIRPGTDGALALGMIQVMLAEELHDEDFADRWTHGFDDLARYVQHFRPEVVEEITGVPAATTRTLARRIAGAAGACPIMYTGLEYSNSGIQAIRAVQTLFALAGQLDVPGGIGLATRGSHFPINRESNIPNPDPDRAVARDRLPLYTRYRGEGHATGLVDAVLHGDPYPIRGLIIHGASILTSWPETPVWCETLSELDFLVTIDRQLTADAAYADIVLPATTMFEIQSYMTYGPIFRLRERMIEPVGEARNDYRIMAELADRLGYGERFPQTEEAMIRQALDGSGYTLEDVREAGGHVRIDAPMMEYRKWEKGGLRPDGEPGFDTPTGKFEIRSTILEEYGYEPLPKYTEPVEGPLGSPDLARDYPLVFNSGARPQTDFRSQHHGVPGLVKDRPEPTVEINTADAADRRIADGDLVEVRTPRGAVPFRALVTDDIVAGAIECSMGGGGPVGPPAWQEWNVNELTDLSNRDEISGFPVYKALLCEVAPLPPDHPAGAEASGRAEARVSGQDRRRTGGEASAGLTGSVFHKDGRQAGADASATAEASVSERGGGQGSRGGRDAGGSDTAAQPARGSSPDGSPTASPAAYLDNNATTRVADGVRDAMAPYLDAAHGNPSSLHGRGRDAKAAVEDARRSVAALIGAMPRRIVFTGGGSEADNLALKGVAMRPGNEGGRIITSAIEHPAVLRTAEFLERLGWPVTYLEADADGRVDPADLEVALADAVKAAGENGGPGPIVVSVMMANNEVGTIQPVAELAARAHDYGALFHTDAVQAVGKIPVDVEALGVDLLSLSGHKIHGPKGVGALYVRKGVELEPVIHGGKQERSLRAGTENVPGIVGLGKAAELARGAVQEADRVARLRDRLEDGVRALIPEARLNGSVDGRLPNTLNLTLPGLRGESLVLALDQHGIALSSGSACKAGSPDPTHVLLAMGRSDEEAHCAVRFSLSTHTTDDDISATLDALEQVLRELETTVRFLPCR
ncbi:MAG: aminotransferase class V-fold PLP-dependent enzyme [Candidatus Longimicrobiales bacterium M2_2A_002]